MHRDLFRSRERGFTLIETMITVAIAAMISLALLEMNYQSMRAQNNTRLDLEALDLKNLSSLLMQNGVACTASLQTATHPSYVFNSNVAANPNQAVPLTGLQYPPPNTTVIAAPGTSPTTGLTVTKLVLDQFQQVAAGSNYMANIHAILTKSSNFLGSPTVSFDIPVDLQTTTAGTTASITGCGSSSTPTGVDEWWTFAGCTNTSHSNLASCYGTASLPQPMSDTNYQVICMADDSPSGKSPSGVISVGSPGMQTNEFSYVYTEVMINGAGTYTPNIMCHAHHN